VTCSAVTEQRNVWSNVRQDSPVRAHCTGVKVLCLSNETRVLKGSAVAAPATANVAKRESAKKTRRHYFWGCSAWAAGGSGCRWSCDHPSEGAKRAYELQFRDDGDNGGEGDVGDVVGSEGPQKRSRSDHGDGASGSE
jgi:hypothetical protein